MSFFSAFSQLSHAFLEFTPVPTRCLLREIKAQSPTCRESNPLIQAFHLASWQAGGGYASFDDAFKLVALGAPVDHGHCIGLQMAARRGDLDAMEKFLSLNHPNAPIPSLVKAHSWSVKNGHDSARMRLASMPHASNEIEALEDTALSTARRAMSDTDALRAKDQFESASQAFSWLADHVSSSAKHGLETQERVARYRQFAQQFNSRKTLEPEPALAKTKKWRGARRAQRLPVTAWLPIQPSILPLPPRHGNNEARRIHDRRSI